MSKGTYKGLHVDKEKLPDWITEFADANFSTSEVSDINLISGTQHRCIIKGDEKEVSLDFYFSKGKTTMLPVGKNKDISIKLADFIMNKIEYKNADIKSKSHSIKSVEKEAFQELIEYLTQLQGIGLIKEKRNEVNKSRMLQFSSNIGDKITLVYFDNKTLQIQGKPMYLYHEVTIFLSAFIDFDQVIANQNEHLDVKVTALEVRNEMKELLPCAYNILDDNLKKILAGSLMLQKVDMPFEDYSPIVFPALKVLEGYLKGILRNKGIIVGKEGFGGTFQPNGPKHVLNLRNKNIINDGVTTSVVEALYDYYKKNRHVLFHVSAIDADTKIIETKQEADLIISDVLSLIETTHMDLQSVSK
ncbi:type II toxin-antitoxin system RnlA family toxin [Paenibacillus sp. MCAF9]|uniref:type II toxin-antitoxin system RnlA family toxin n=1 Tax=Paenibacillus sp. MCAF9 TaxID=3233046 RepID=UPI003F9B14CC